MNWSNRSFRARPVLLDDLSRRDFLKVLGASLALAGLTACVPQSSQKIIPYVKPPEQLVPGKTDVLCQRDGAGRLCQRRAGRKRPMGRPIKVEGNPNHPDSLGATDIFMQASILELYDPDRAQAGDQPGRRQNLGRFYRGNRSDAGEPGRRRRAAHSDRPGDLTDADGPDHGAAAKVSPGQMGSVQPGGARTTARPAANQAFGQAVEAVYNFNKADVILSLDSDFLFSEPGHLRYSRDFAARHQPISTSGTMNRLYVVESSATLTGSNADHRLAVKPSQVEAFARAVASRLGVGGSAPAGDVPGQELAGPAGGGSEDAPGEPRWWSPASASRPRCTPWRTP